MSTWLEVNTADDRFSYVLCLCKETLCKPCLEVRSELSLKPATSEFATALRLTKARVQVPRLQIILSWCSTCRHPLTFTKLNLFLN